MCDVVVEVLANGRKLLLAGIVSLALLICFRTGFLKSSELLLEFLHAVGKKRVALLFELLDLELQFFFQLGELAVTRIDVHVDDHVGGEVDDLL